MSRPRVLIAKPGLDGHDRGAKVVAMALRDAGAEIIYLGQRRTAAQIAGAALDEDVDVIGLSILSGAHFEHTRAVIDECGRVGIDVPVVVGGVFTPDDAAELVRMGAAAAYPTESDLDRIAREVVALASESRGARS